MIIKQKHSVFMPGLMSCVLVVLSFFSALVLAASTDTSGVTASGLPKEKVAKADQAAADTLTAILGPIENFSASFSQRVVDDSGELLEDYKGRMVVQKPGKLYWVSAEPVSQTVVSDGSTIWFYDADLEQVTQQKFSEDFQSTPALLLGGDAKKISTQFSVSMMNEKQSETGAKEKPVKAAEYFLLYPKAENAMFDSLKLEILDGQVVALQMKDSLGQITSIAFTDIKVNGKVAENLFTFVAPEGVEIIVDE